MAEPLIQLPSFRPFLGAGEYRSKKAKIYLQFTLQSGRLTMNKLNKQWSDILESDKYHRKVQRQNTRGRGGQEGITAKVTAERLRKRRCEPCGNLGIKTFQAEDQEKP